VTDPDPDHDDDQVPDVLPDPPPDVLSRDPLVLDLASGIYGPVND
jgi:hypothetical protein